MTVEVQLVEPDGAAKPAEAARDVVAKSWKVLSCSPAGTPWRAVAAELAPGGGGSARRRPVD